MNPSSYGYPSAPNKATRVAPPKWSSHKIIRVTTSGEVVPQNVFQMGVAVFGAGGSGGCHGSHQATGGGGGGFAFGIIDVTPGQLLPVCTIGVGGAGVSSNNPGNSGGTSSFGSILTATGGSGGLTQSASSSVLNGGAGGIGIALKGLRGVITNPGGRGGSKTGTNPGVKTCTGGGASGSMFGPGGRGGDMQSDSSTNGTLITGGGGWALGHGGDILVTATATGMYTGGGGFGHSGGSVSGDTTSYSGGGGSASEGDSVVANNTLAWGGSGVLGYGGKPNAVSLEEASTSGLMYPVSLVDIILNAGVFTGGGGGSGGTKPYNNASIGGGSGGGDGCGNGGPGGGSGGSVAAAGQGGFGGGGGGGTFLYPYFSGSVMGGGSGGGLTNSLKAGDGLIALFWTEGY